MVVSQESAMAHGIKQELEGAVPPTPERQAKVEEKKGKSEGKGMSSRRIFSPQFKLQVLNSYRTDADCKGNQRATARKYGIHRRQIQKWLQMESNLRLTVQAVSENGLNKSEDEMALNLSPARQRDDSAPVEISMAGCLGTPVPINLQHPSPSSVSDTEEINVDGDSSSEDDVSSSDSYDRTDQALDFTCAALSKRRFYSTNFKLQVLDAFYYDKNCHGNQRAIARKFGIHRRQVQKWLKGEKSLRNDVGDDCLDLSCKKRKAEEDLCEIQSKRVSSGCCNNFSCEERIEVSSYQETALCLVKPRTPHEVSSTIDLYTYPTSSVCYLSPTELPTYDPYYLPCWSTPFYPSRPIENVPKWFSNDYSESTIKVPVYGFYR